MKTQSILTDLIQFKDEIFKKIRLLENRLTTDITEKFNQTNLIYESINNKVNLITTSNDSLLELLTTQKLNIDKTEKLEKIVDKIESNIYKNEIKMRQISSEIERLKNGYEKIIYENLQVSGYIGSGYKYKNFSDYIRDSVTKISEFKTEKEKMNMENMFLKTRLDNLIKSTLTSSENNILICQKYTDRMNNEIKSYLENRLDTFNEKNLNLRALIYKTEIDNEKNLKNLKIDLEQLQNMKEEFNNKTENKIIELNLKIEDLLKDIQLLKTNNNNNNNNNNKDNNNNIRKLFLNSDINKNNKALLNNNENENNNEDIINNNSKPNISNEKKNININSNDKIKEKINSDESIFKKRNQKNIAKEISSRDFEKINKDNSRNKEEKKEETFLIKENNIIKKVINHKNKKEKNKINEIDIDINNNIKNKIKNNFIKEKIKSENIIENIEKEKLAINSQHTISKPKNKRNIFERNKSVLQTKIKIESQENKKLSLSNDSSLINVSNHNKKNEENETEIIKSIYYNKQRDKKKEIITKPSEKELPIYQKFSNENIINKIKQRNFNSYYLISPNKSLNIQEKKDEDIFQINEGHKQIMSDKKTNFNLIKERREQKYLEDLIDSNVIDLHLDKQNIITKRKLKKESARINLNNNNNINEIGMKLSPAFGRTNYHFYIKNKSGESYEDLRNGLPKMSSLKATLKAAYISSIKNKIYSNDKGNSFS